MRVWSSLFNFIAVLCIIVLVGTYMNFSSTLDFEFEQARYNYAVKQATEAMFRETLTTEDLDMDYADMSYVSIDSSQALDVFSRVLCANYNMSPSETNFTAIQNSIASCVIAGYDGYYILQHSDANTIENNGLANDGYKALFSVKMPYLVEANNQVYAIDTYKKTSVSMSKVDNSAEPNVDFVGADFPPGVDLDDIKKSINKQIRSSILTEAANSRNLDLGSFEDFNLFFPENTTVTGVNPFDVPAIFVLMDGSDFSGTANMQSLSASGFKVVKRVRVVGFTDTKTGHSYYCYEGQLRDSEKTLDSGGISTGGIQGTFRIDNYFDTIGEAARAVNEDTGEHYSPYAEIMSRKITVND